jgi:hypothetical protein
VASNGIQWVGLAATVQFERAPNTKAKQQPAQARLSYLITQAYGMGHSSRLCHVLPFPLSAHVMCPGSSGNLLHSRQLCLSTIGWGATLAYGALEGYLLYMLLLRSQIRPPALQ